MTTPIFVDGFDLYGAVGEVSQNAQLQTLLQQLWTTASAAFSIVAGLSSTGTALTFSSASNTGLYETLPANYSRVVGTMRMASTLAACCGITFFDTTNAQFSIGINTTGTVSLFSGALSGTAIATSAASVSANAAHVLSWDVTAGSAGAYQVWLDGVSLFSGTGNTRAGSANSYVNRMGLGSNGNGNATYDDFALIDGSQAFDATITTSNARIETQLPSGDVQTQFTNVGAIVNPSGANPGAYSATSNAPGANKLYLRKVTAPVAMTLNSVSGVPATTSSTANFKACAYADSGGNPSGQSLLSGGTQVTGCTAGSTLTGALSTPVSLSAGETLWVGFIGDTSIAFYEQGTNDSTGVSATSTYTSGVPSTCPTVTTGQPSWDFWGNCTGATVNYEAVDHRVAPGDVSSISSSTVGNEDLYSFPALSTTPSTIFFGAVLANVKRSDSGSRTIDLRVKSGTSDSAGSNTVQSPALSYGWLSSFFSTDPATGVAWTASGWNAARSGVSIAS
jgi:hypothetical protein